MSSVRYVSMAYLGALLMYILRKSPMKSGNPSMSSALNFSELIDGFMLSVYAVVTLKDVSISSTKLTPRQTDTVSRRSCVMMSPPM